VTPNPAPEARARARDMALRIAGAYFVFGFLWILFTDTAVELLSADPEFRARVQLLKGWLFVALSALVVFLLARRLLARELANRWFRDLASDQLPDVVLDFRPGPPPAFAYLNAAVESLTGLPPKTFLADPAAWEASIHPADRAHVMERLRAPDPGDAPLLARWVTPGGETRWGELAVTAEPDHEGQPRVVRGVLRDVTARILSERSERRLQEALERARVGVLLLDARGQVRSANPGAHELLGWPDARLDGSGPFLLPAGTPLVERLASGMHGSVRVQGGGGEAADRVVELASAPVEGGDDEAAFLVVARDGTVEAALEERVRAAQRLEALGRFAGGLAHDFRNLLGVVLLQAEEARRSLAEGASSEALRALGELEGAVRRGEGLVRKLLSTGTGGPSELTRVEPARLLEEIRPALRAMVSPGVRLEFRIDERVPPLQADAGSLEQVLLNLVKNASEALGDAGLVEVGLAPWGESDAPEGTASTNGEGVHLWVRDDGPGMSPSVLARVFEPFFTTRPDSGGTGLGLPTARSVAQQHGGRLLLDSREGEGTTAHLFLPSDPDRRAPRAGSRSPSASGASAEPAPRGSGGAERLLLVDDEPAIRATTARALRRLGYTVIEATDGAAALDLLTGGAATVMDGLDVDLLLSDVVMPRMGGPELVSRYQAAGGTGSILFMSGYALEAVGATARATREAAFLEKPWSMAELERTVRSLLDARAVPEGPTEPA
jgi:two-component system, cell cycle sensor histidine kinase and response regulator CckA